LSCRHEARVLTSGYERVIYVSKEDQLTAAALTGHAGPPIDLLPIGVDADYWQKPTHSEPAIDAVPVRVLFAGVMSYRPNIDAAELFVNRILPKLHEDVEVRIVGKDPPDVIRNLASKDRRVVVTGTVPDMRTEYWGADIFVAPMTETSGIKIKVLQAMAAGLPVVASQRAVEGFPVLPGGVIPTFSDQEFAESLAVLIRDREQRRTLGQAGRDCVETGWSWDSRAQRLVDLLTS
jgi:glycosyltransferase involved in cell wall biosynthesis